MISEKLVGFGADLEILLPGFLQLKPTIRLDSYCPTACSTVLATVRRCRATEKEELVISTPFFLWKAVACQWAPPRS